MKRDVEIEDQINAKIAKSLKKATLDTAIGLQHLKALGELRAGKKTDSPVAAWRFSEITMKISGQNLETEACAVLKNAGQYYLEALVIETRAGDTWRDKLFALSQPTKIRLVLIYKQAPWPTLRQRWGKIAQTTLITRWRLEGLPDWLAKQWELLPERLIKRFWR
jgi:nitroreductase